LVSIRKVVSIFYFWQFNGAFRSRAIIKGDSFQRIASCSSKASAEEKREKKAEEGESFHRDIVFS
jgi:hypothetical protein